MVGAVVSNVRFDARVVRGDFELDAAFTLPAGSTTAIVGPNGAGKSTILAAIAGLEAARSGTIEIAGFVVDDPSTGIFVPSRDRHVGVVFQDHLLFPNLTVLENVAFGLRARGQSRLAADAAASALLQRHELAEFASRRPDQLSGGQAQRVALVRALASEPDVLALDEPLSALDVEARASVRSQLARHLADFAGPVVMVTHDPLDAKLLADQLVVLEAGKVVQIGTPVEVGRQPATSYVASFAGLNHLRAHVDQGQIKVAGVDVALQTSEMSVAGDALVTIAPSAVALHRERPGGSPRNVWSTKISGVEDFGDVRRVILGDPLELAADLTPAAVESLDLRAGQEIWASVKATEVRVVQL